MHKKKTEEMEADHQEFTRLIRENQAILYDFIKCRILDKSLAQDVLQETLYMLNCNPRFHTRYLG